MAQTDKEIEMSQKITTSDEKAFLESIIENIPDMVFVKDAKDLKFLKFNKAGEDLLGYKRSDLLGKSDYDFFPKKEADFFIEKDRAVLDSNEILDIPEEIIKTTHGERILHTKKISIRNSEGKPEYLLGISEDITLRKDLSKKIKEVSEKQSVTLGFLQDFIENSTDRIVFVDKDSKVVVYNTAYRDEVKKIFGTEMSTGITFNELMGAAPKDQIDGVSALWKRALEGEKFSIFQKFGSDQYTYNYYVITFYPLKNKEGQIMGAMHVGQNINEHKQDKAILESLGEGVIVTDHLGKIMMINPKALELIGVNKDSELIGKQLLESVKVLDSKGVMIPAETRFNSTNSTNRASVSNIYFYVRKDGSKFPAVSTITPVKVDNNLAGTVEIFRDISKEQAFEKTKNEFLSLVSHELRTPLTIANWYAEAYFKSIDSIDLAKQKEYVGEIRKALEHVNEIVGAILQISQIELGKIKLEKTNLDIVALTGEIVHGFILESQQSGLLIKTDFGGPSLRCLVSKNLFTIVLNNLISNAIKYSKSNGEINIKINLEKDSLVMEVKDHGCGIPEIDQEKIFTKLFRAENAKELKVSGTGLGLYITKLFLEQVKGEIWFSSIENEGTTFYVKIPISPGSS